MKKLRMYPHKTDGKLITFCGLDGCGKSTMISMLAEYFSNASEKDVVLCRQPTDEVRGSEIFRTFMDKADNSAYDYRALSFLAASDRIQHSNRFIMDNLRAGKVVISDRYFYSCVANLMSRGFTKDKWIFEAAKFIPKPDAAFFLDLPVALAVKRVRNREEEKHNYIDLNLQYKLKENYLEIARKCGGDIIPSCGEATETFRIIEKILKEREILK